MREAESFTSDQVTSAIKSCRNSRAYDPDSLSIFNLKNLGPLSTEYLAALYDSLNSCRLPSIWKTSLVISISNPGKDSSQCTSYRPISLLCPSTKVLEALMLLLSTHSLVCPIIQFFVHQPAYLSIWPAAPSLQRGLSTNPGVTMWCVFGCS